MPRYTVGGPVRVAGTVRDVNTGLLATPGTILLRVWKPDGTVLPDYTTPTADSVGVYHQDLPAADLAMAGHYPYVWVTSGTGAGVSPPNSFDLGAQNESELLSLQDAKAHLGETGSFQDDEIRACAQVATEVVESIVGPCTPQTFVDEVKASAYCTQLLLPRRPVITVTSVASVWTGGPTWTTAALQVNRDAGIVRLLSRGSFFDEPFNVTYTAGRTVVPDRYVQAAKAMLFHLWKPQRAQTVDSPLPDFSEEQFGGAAFGPGFAIPNEVRELLAVDGNQNSGIA